MIDWRFLARFLSAEVRWRLVSILMVCGCGCGAPYKSRDNEACVRSFCTRIEEEYMSDDEDALDMADVGGSPDKIDDSALFSSSSLLL